MADKTPKLFYRVTWKGDSGVEYSVVLLFQHRLEGINNAILRIREVRKCLIKQKGYVKSGIDPKSIIRIEEVFKDETTYSEELD